MNSPSFFIVEDDRYCWRRNIENSEG